MSRGIDYGLGQTNIDKANGIRYGVISSHDVSQAWADSSEADYGDACCPKCGNYAYAIDAPEVPDIDEEENWTDEGRDYACTECRYSFDASEAYGDEPLGFTLDDGEYKASQSGDDNDIFIMDSPYYTRASFCSPCAPGACYLTSPCDDGEKAYCFGHEWFDDGIAPYPVYRVSDDKQLVATRETVSCDRCKGTARLLVESIAIARKSTLADILADSELMGRLDDYDSSNHSFACWQCSGKGTQNKVVVREV